MTNLPVYQCHKKVGAAKILIVGDAGSEGTRSLELDVPNHETVLVDEAWMRRNPKVAAGGYFVCYIENEDKYTAYSPAEPFEKGYTLIQPQGKTRAERIDKLVKDINSLIDDCRGEEILTYAEIVGVLDMVKFDVIAEVRG